MIGWLVAVALVLSAFGTAPARADRWKALEDVRMAGRLAPRGDSIEKGALERIADIRGRSRQALPKTVP